MSNQSDKAHRCLTVLGGGSFGTALADIAAGNGYRTRLWMRDGDAVEAIRATRINARYLPDLRLHEWVEPTDDIKAAVADAGIVLFAIPSKSFRSIAERVKPFLEPEQLLVSTTKGIEPDSLNLMSQILRSEFPRNPIGVIGGPNLAKEIARKELTATVIASEDSRLRKAVQEAFGCEYFRVYASADVLGVELGGALKNIYAIMAGITVAKGLGENTLAMLMTRSLAEMGRFASALGANPMTFLGLAGVGDLIATCSSPLSRNYRVGYALGEGCSLDQAVAALGEVAEGVNTLLQVKRYADAQGIYMPLVQGLFKVVYESVPLAQVIRQLMTAEQSSDVEFTLAKAEI
jgi:glycerol-3-phosphate dehydrogenase (NAD(P)+)